MKVTAAEASVGFRSDESAKVTAAAEASVGFRGEEGDLFER